MDKSAFSRTSPDDRWWLQLDVLPDPVATARDAVGEKRGWRGDIWYQQGDKLEALYEFLDKYQRDLLTRLDSASDDSSRKSWLDDVATALGTWAKTSGIVDGAEVDHSVTTAFEADKTFLDELEAAMKALDDEYDET